MKKLLLILVLASSSFVTFAQRNIDVLHYKFNIEISDSSDIIRGEAAIRFKSLKTISSIELDFTKYNQGKGMNVLSIYQGEKNENRLTFSNENNKLKIKLADTLKEGTEQLINLTYWGVPTDGLIISKNQYGNRTFFGDNWPNRAHNWLPCVDDIADKATVEFIVTAPSHYQVISNGVQIEETNLPGNKKLTHYKEDVPLPTKVMVIGAADFAVNNVGEVNCVPVSSWVFPENKKDGFYDYALAKDILAFYMDYIGPYGYKKLANVQSKTKFGGMENASAIFYAEYSVNGHRGEESLLAHEIAHQWFGDMATEKSFAHLWLSEGFATYLTHIYIEARYGTDSLTRRMKNEREEIIDFVKTSHRSVVDSTSDYMSMLNANSYQKGGWILHMLRRQLGDSVFHKSIKEYYAAYAGKNADTKDLQKIFETVSGKSLEKFFRQWLHTPVNPEIKINWKYIAKEKKVMITVEQLQQSVPFEFPLEITIGQSSAKPQVQKLNITKKLETFSFPAASNKITITADPFTSLLFEGRVTELQ